MSTEKTERKNKVPGEIVVPVQEESYSWSLTPDLAKPSSLSMTTPSRSNSYVSYAYKNENKEPPSPESDRVSEESAEAEVLMDNNRTLVRTGSGNFQIWVDQACGVMDLGVVEKLAGCSAYIIVHRSSGHYRTQEAGSFCQVALVEDHDGVKRIVTTKHSFGSRKVRNRTHLVDSIALGSPRSLDNYLIPFPNAVPDRLEESDPVELRQGEVWRHGIDYLWGPSCKDFSAVDLEEYNGYLSDLIENFSMVRQDFKVQAGQKIGIVVYNRYTVKKTSSAVQKSSFKTAEGLVDEDLTDEKLETIFGPPGSVVIHVGNITYVGKKHIEYGLNSTKGCSGAVVFLLDVEGQPDSVREDDRGKAIAVHAGCHPKLGTNIGFVFSSLELQEGSTAPEN